MVIFAKVIVGVFMVPRPESIAIPEATVPDLVSLIVDVVGLSKTDAEIYALGLEKGQLCSADVRDGLGLSQPSAVQHLQRLTHGGFFVGTAPIVGSGRDTRQVFRVVRLTQVTASKREAYKRLERLVDLDEADDELRGPGDGASDRIWVVPAKALVGHFRRNADAAVRSLEISCNDGTWASEPDVMDCVRLAKSHKVRVSVYSSGLSPETRSSLKRAGVVLKRPSSSNPVFALIDRRVLYLPVQEGHLKTAYSAIYTTNRYLVDKMVLVLMGGRRR